MKLGDQLTYRADRYWRPQPTIIKEDSLNLYGICFSWGEVDLSGKILENIRFYIEACLNQSEITNPFGVNESLSSLENALRSGVILANDVIYRLVNKTSLSSGAECLVLVKSGRELAMAQIGQPHVLLRRNGNSVPVLTAFDNVPVNNSDGSFLPSRLLGTHTNCYPHIQSLHVEHGDELILLAHSQLPSSALKAPQDLKKLFQSISLESPLCPFWLSSISI